MARGRRNKQQQQPQQAQNFQPHEVTHKRETFQQQLALRDAAEARCWIKKMLNVDIPNTADLQEVLKDGLALIQCINVVLDEKDRITSYHVPKSASAKLPEFHMMENVQLFLKKTATLGVEKDLIFVPPDLVESRNLKKVYRTLVEVARVGEQRGKIQNADEVSDWVEETMKEYEMFDATNVTDESTQKTHSQITQLATDAKKESATTTSTEQSEEQQQQQDDDDSENQEQQEDAEAKEREEKERQELERQERERQEKERKEQERKEKERQEKERKEKERQELERKEKERQELERKEKERQEKERKEKEQKEKERKEKERKEQEQKEKERKEKERKEKERKEKEREEQRRNEEERRRNMEQAPVHVEDVMVESTGHSSSTKEPLLSNSTEKTPLQAKKQPKSDSCCDGCTLL